MAKRIGGFLPDIEANELAIGSGWILCYVHDTCLWQYWTVQPGDDVWYLQSKWTLQDIVNMGKLPTPEDRESKRHFELWEKFTKMGMFNVVRCDSILYTKNGPVRCIGSRPSEDETHTHVGRVGGLRITWTDKDAKESRDVNKTDKPFIGWRTWELQKGGFLRSVTAKVTWTGPVLRSNGPPRTHMFQESPSVTDFGIYCYKSPRLLYEHLGYGIEEEGRWPVIGCIELSGRVVEHEKGYRAQVATLRKLWYVPRDDVAAGMFGLNLKKDLENRYQCEVETIPRTQVKHWVRFIDPEEEV